MNGDDVNGLRFSRVTGICVLLVACSPLSASAISIEGAPADTGFNVGSEATIRATLRGLPGDPAGYAVFAEIQYVGTTAVTSVQMEQQAESKPDEVRYETGWPIPADAPTGLYSVALRVEDRTTHKVVATRKLRGFAAYRKLLRISRALIDRTFYHPGDTIQCEVVLENLTDRDLNDLRVEFSNANYPWISLYSEEAGPGGKAAENPDLRIKVLRDHLALPAHHEVTIPMMPAGTAAFLQGEQVTVLGAGGPARHEKIPPPEVDQYTIAVWNADRTILYDMQFSTPAIVRPPDRDLPKPYGRNFTHPYNSDIDFKKYREFYAPGQVSPAITVDSSRTLYRPGDKVSLKVTATNFRNVSELEIRARIKDPAGRLFEAPNAIQVTHVAPGSKEQTQYDVWTVPADAADGVYSMTVWTPGPDGKPVAQTATEIAVNVLPASLLVFCAHEDDEQAYAGLIRAAVEAGIPVRVVFFTGGDVGACERYYSKPCGPNEAREFGLVRMEETSQALEHMGLTRDKLTFLGLPDGGSGSIWSQHIKAANPFMSIYLACDHAPYENVLKPNLPYAREAVIELAKQIITDFRPAMIATAHPDERHVDHRTANWFTIKACQELLREKRIDPQTIVLGDQSYGAGGFKPAPYRYEKVTVFLSGEASALKQEMSWLYQSQDGNLEEGMRQTFAELPRQEIHLRIVDWQEHAGWNE
jgi:LmbE family N-acetylglucosaminyl deacetylase